MNALADNSYIALPFSEWPHDEQNAWLSAKAKGNVFDGQGPAAAWSPHTQDKIELTVGRFLKWLLVGRGIAHPRVPSNLDQPTLQSYLAFLQPRVSPVSAHMYINDLRRYCQVARPEADRSVLNTLARNLQWRATPSRNKRAKIVDLNALVDLGRDFQDIGRTLIDTHPVRGAILVRDGFAISLLALRPLRIRAFGSLQIGHHLEQIGGQWHILIPPELSKTKQHWEGPFPNVLRADLEYYLEVARPKLLTDQRSKPWVKRRAKARTELWVGRSGQALPHKELGAAIARHTQRHFGVRIGPHMFRDCAATYVAIYSGKDVGIIKSVLGHSTMRTAEQYYNQANQSDAVGKLDEAISAISANLTRKKGRARR
ncbi:site-specific tyrosine recombinase XerC [Shimia thalassica]|uniref:Site-specific tyrosine recombinase XerC n=1 Tax=Shimia thalassica TaxID=1715693 RepID=A0A0P1HZM0_9RHOB|nr:site-specific integrase [Shimia thalassica]CUJ81304.1 site-specific tyrosine recombinase XerC [Shimia thalassica]